MKKNIYFTIIFLIFTSCGSNLTYDEQISQYNKLISSSDSLYNIKKYNQAILYSTKAIKICDTLPKAYIERGYSNLALNNLDDAEDDFSEAIDIEGKKSIAFRGRAITNLLNNEKNDFLDDINIYLINYNNDVYAHSLRGDYYADDEEYENAINDYSFCIKNEPENSSFYLKRGNVYAMNEQNKLSIIDYENFTRLNPKENNDQIFYKRAILNIKTENYQKAIDDFSLISKNFNKNEMFELKGDCFYNLKNYNEAINNYTFYLIKVPNNYEVIEKRGNSHFKNNNNTTANLDYQKVALLKWNSKGVFYKYGWYFLFVFGYFCVYIIIRKTIKEEYDNKKIGKSYMYFFISGILGGHYLYSDIKWRYAIHTFLIFALLLINSYSIRSFYNHYELLWYGISNSQYSLYIIYSLLVILLFDFIFLPYIIFSHNHNLRISVSDRASRQREIEMEELEIVSKKHNTNFKTIKS